MDGNVLETTLVIPPFLEFISPISSAFRIKTLGDVDFRNIWDD